MQKLITTDVSNGVPQDLDTAIQNFINTTQSQTSKTVEVTAAMGFGINHEAWPNTASALIFYKLV